MNTLLYEPAEGDPHRVITPQAPFCYPPTAHRYADWVPLDGWREGPAKGWYLGDTPPVPRQALILIWKGKFLSDAYHRLHEVMSGVEKQQWRTADGWWIKYPDMAKLDTNQPIDFVHSMCIRPELPDWLKEEQTVRTWCLGRGAVKCLRGNLIEWEAP